MEDGIYTNNLKKISSETLLPIQKHTYVPNMGSLQQTMLWKWSYLGRLLWNLYMFIDDRLFVKHSFKFFVKTRVYYFLYQLLYIKGLHAKGFHFLSNLSLYLMFSKKWSKWPPWLFVERGQNFQNHWWSCDIITTCLP